MLFFNSFDFTFDGHSYFPEPSTSESSGSLEEMKVAYGRSVPPGLQGPTRGEVRFRLDRLALSDLQVMATPFTQSATATAISSPRERRLLDVTPFLDQLRLDVIWWGDGIGNPTARCRAPRSSGVRASVLVFPIRTTASAFRDYLTDADAVGAQLTAPAGEGQEGHVVPQVAVPTELGGVVILITCPATVTGWKADAIVGWARLSAAKVFSSAVPQKDGASTGSDDTRNTSAAAKTQARGTNAWTTVYATPSNGADNSVAVGRLKFAATVHFFANQAEISAKAAQLLVSAPATFVVASQAGAEEASHGEPSLSADAGKRVHFADPLGAPQGPASTTPAVASRAVPPSSSAGLRSASLLEAVPEKTIARSGADLFAPEVLPSKLPPRDATETGGKSGHPSHLIAVDDAPQIKQVSSDVVNTAVDEQPMLHPSELVQQLLKRGEALLQRIDGNLAPSSQGIAPQKHCHHHRDSVLRPVVASNGPSSIMTGLVRLRSKENEFPTATAVAAAMPKRVTAVSTGHVPTDAVTDSDDGDDGSLSSSSDSDSDGDVVDRRTYGPHHRRLASRLPKARFDRPVSSVLTCHVENAVSLPAEVATVLRGGFLVVASLRSVFGPAGSSIFAAQTPGGGANSMFLFRAKVSRDVMMRPRRQSDGLQFSDGETVAEVLRESLPADDDADADDRAELAFEAESFSTASRIVIEVLQATIQTKNRKITALHFIGLCSFPLRQLSNVTVALRNPILAPHCHVADVVLDVDVDPRQRNQQSPIHIDVPSNERQSEQNDAERNGNEQPIVRFAAAPSSSRADGSQKREQPDSRPSGASLPADTVGQSTTTPPLAPPHGTEQLSGGFPRSGLVVSPASAAMVAPQRAMPHDASRPVARDTSASTIDASPGSESEASPFLIRLRALQREPEGDAAAGNEISLTAPGSPPCSGSLASALHRLCRTILGVQIFGARNLPLVTMNRGVDVSESVCLEQLPAVSVRVASVDVSSNSDALGVNNDPTAQRVTVNVTDDELSEWYTLRSDETEVAPPSCHPTFEYADWLLIPHATLSTLLSVTFEVSVVAVQGPSQQRCVLGTCDVPLRALPAMLRAGGPRVAAIDGWYHINRQVGSPSDQTSARADGTSGGSSAPAITDEQQRSEASFNIVGQLHIAVRVVSA